MRLCNVENCNKKHEARGYCKSHYKSYMRYGNPLQVDINRELRKQKAELQKSKPRKTRQSRDGVCSVENCNKPIKSRRLCEKHYARMRRNNTLEISSIERGKVKTCLAVGCDRPHKTHGYCETHYKNYRHTGSPHLPKVIKYCGVKGCNNKHDAKGLCSNHYRLWRKNLKQLE